MARILIIDDEPAILSVLARILEGRGHTVFQASNGKVALRDPAGFSADLVLTDIFMPEMDGYEVIAQVKKSWPGVPIVAMSGGGIMPKSSVLMTASVLGVAAILEKPFDVTEVGDLVERLLGAG